MVTFLSSYRKHNFSCLYFGCFQWRTQVFFLSFKGGVLQLDGGSDTVPEQAGKNPEKGGGGGCLNPQTPPRTRMGCLFVHYFKYHYTSQTSNFHPLQIERPQWGGGGGGGGGGVLPL